MMRTRDQERSRHAWDTLQKMQKKAGGKLDANLVSDLKALPGMIQINGLSAVTSYLQQKHRDISESLADFLNIGTELTKFLTDCGGKDYARLTEEALAYTNWLKRWATALEAPKNKQDQNGGTNGAAKR